MRASLALLLLTAAMANYLPFTPSAYWNNTGTFLNNTTSYYVSQTNTPDGSNDYQISTVIGSPCAQGGPWYAPWWEMDHHLLRATPDYNFNQGSAYDVVYNSNNCGQSGNPSLYVYKVENGSPTLLLNVQLSGSQAGQTFTTFIRQDGPNPGLHIKLGFNEWHVNDTSLTSGYPGYAATLGQSLYGFTPTYNEIDRLPPNTPTNLQTTAWPTIADLQWAAPSDPGSGVTNYLLYKNGTYVTSLPAGTSTYSFGALTPGTTYTFGVTAQDKHFNVSTTATTAVTTANINQNIPVVPTRLGIHRFSQSWGAGDLGESIDTLSGNLNFSLPIASIALRGGGSIPFALSYNAQIWRKDGSIVKRLAGDLGYGHGWRLQAGAITPIWNGAAFSHFVFTDSTGAEYALGTNNNGVWTGKDGAYVSYDQNTRRLWFNSGIFWAMDCISGSTEVDAGTRYPTRIQNANGNYVLITYKAAIGSSTANTSARIDNLNDMRGQLIYLTYNNDAIPHANYINGQYLGLNKAFTYTAGTLTDPFNGASYGTQSQLTALTIASTPAGSNYAFAYNGNGELLTAKLPRNGELRYTHQSTTMGNNITIRELTNRRLVKQAGGSEVTYSFVRDSNDSSQALHSSLALTDPSGIGRKRWLFSTAANYTRGFLSQYIEHPTATGDTNILRRHTYTYTQDANLMPAVQSVTTELDPGTADAKTMKTDQTVDLYGNVTQSRLYEYGNLTTPARTTNCTYYFPNNHYLRNLSSGCTLTDGTSTISLGGASYDSYGAGLTQVTGSPSNHDTANYGTTYTQRGNPTTISSPGKTTFLTYNILGEVIRAVTNGQQVDWTYSSSNNFGAPTVITPNSNANLQTIMNWNSLLQPTGSSSPNGNSAAAGYDSLNRPSTQTNGDGVTASVSYQDNLNQTTATSPISSTRTTYDGLGRPIRVESFDPGTGTLKSTVDTEYDSCTCSPAGKLKRQSMPYAPGGTVLWTTYVYDGLGRTLQVIQPHTSGTGSAGTTTYAYAGNKVTVTDPAGRWKRYLQTAVGNLVQVTEPNPAGGADYETYYTYNLRDQLTLVQMPRPNQVGGTYTQTRTFVYDANGWLTSTTNPENGTTTYNYDFYGKLNYKQDAKGQKVEYTYDANNRVTKMTPKDSGGAIAVCDVVEYFYDLNQNTYGRVSAVQWGSKDLDAQNNALCPKGLHRENYTYTNGGRPTSKTLQLTRKFADLGYAERTAQLAIAYEYESLNARLLKKIYYPTTYTQTGYQTPVLPLAGSTYEYTFDSLGRPTGETRDGTSVVDQVTYNTFGALTQMRQTLANKTETRAYDSFQRLTSMTTLDGVGITYNYSQTANDGKLVSQVTGGEQVNYTYDSLGRLSTAQTSGTGGWGMSWMYDGWGNRLQQAALKGSVPTMVTTTDPTTNRIQSHTYDANGNTVYTPQQGNMTYDVFNRLRTVAADTYAYDPANKRIWKNDEYTLWGARGERVGRYVAVKLIENNGGTLTHSFVFQKVQIDEYFGGRRLSSQDRLGSAGQYYPYGEAKSGTVSNADSFASYYRDSTGLDYAQQRHYASGVGRFLATDQASSQKVSEPASWNRYSYTEGDPVNYADPSGLARCKPVGWTYWSQPTVPQQMTTIDIQCESFGGTVAHWSVSDYQGYLGLNDINQKAVDQLANVGELLDQLEWSDTLNRLSFAKSQILMNGLSAGCKTFLRETLGKSPELLALVVDKEPIYDDIVELATNGIASAGFSNGLTSVFASQFTSNVNYVHAATDNGVTLYWRPGDRGQWDSSWLQANILHEVLHSRFNDATLQRLLIGPKAVNELFTDNITEKLQEKCFK